MTHEPHPSAATGAPIRVAHPSEPTDVTDLLLYGAMLDDPFLDLCYQNVRWFNPTPGRFLEIPSFRSSEVNLYTACGGDPANPINPLGT